MRPYRRGCAAVSLAFTCVNNIHKVDVTIAVMIVLSKIHIVLRINRFDCFNYNVGSISVFALLIIYIRSVIGVVIADGYRSIHVKIRYILTIRLCLKVLTDGIIGTAIGIIRSVHKFVESRLVVGRLH